MYEVQQMVNQDENVLVPGMYCVVNTETGKVYCACLSLEECKRIAKTFNEGADFPS